MIWTQEYPAYGTLHRVGAGSVHGFLAGLIAVLSVLRMIRVRNQATRDIVTSRSINTEVGNDAHYHVPCWMDRSDFRSPPGMRWRPRLEGLDLPVSQRARGLLLCFRECLSRKWRP